MGGFCAFLYCKTKNIYVYSNVNWVFILQSLYIGLPLQCGIAALHAYIRQLIFSCSKIMMVAMATSSNGKTIVTMR